MKCNYLIFSMRAISKCNACQKYCFHLLSYLSPSRHHWYRPIHQQASPGLPFCLINSHEAKKWEVQDLLLAAARSWQGRDGWRNIEKYPHACPLHSAVIQSCRVQQALSAKRKVLVLTVPHSPVRARSHDQPGESVCPDGRSPCGSATMLCTGDPAHHYSTVGELYSSKRSWTRF